MRAGSLFSGAGGLDLAVAEVLGAEVAWHCEIDPAASRVLERNWPGVPNLGDITAVDWGQVLPVEVLCGGSPCQDVSSAGRRAGMRSGTRSGLWAAMCDAIEVLRPRLVVWENVRGVLSAGADSALEFCPGCVGDHGQGAVLRALGRVLGDLADLGYDAVWHGLRAADIGAPHNRFRVFVVATDTSGRGRGTGQHRVSPGQPHPDRIVAADAGRDTRPQNDPHRAVAAGRGGDAAAHAHAHGLGRERAGQARHRWDGSSDGRSPAADAQGYGRHEGRTESAGQLRGSDVALGGAEPDVHADWGQYATAIRRWESALGRPAPDPTVAGQRGGRRLSPVFVEWLMGLPAGHVTDVPGLSRNDMLRILGNGVVPQQAAAALRWMLSALATGEVAA